MKRGIALYLLMTCCVFFLGVNAYSEESKSSSAEATSTNKLENIAALSVDGQEEYVVQLMQERKDFQSRLLNQFTPTASDNVKCTIITILGVYRMTDTIPLIAENITIRYRNPKGFTWAHAIDEYPAVIALIRMGTKAVPSMVNNIASTNDERVRAFSTSVIQGIYGPDIARFVLEKEREKTRDDVSKKRIERSIKQVEETIARIEANTVPAQE